MLSCRVYFTIYVFTASDIESLQWKITYLQGYTHFVGVLQSSVHNVVHENQLLCSLPITLLLIATNLPITTKGSITDMDASFYVYQKHLCIKSVPNFDKDRILGGCYWEGVM